VGISHKETSNPETLMIDVLLVDEHGNVVAEIEGVTGKRISRQSILNIVQREIVGGIQNRFEEVRQQEQQQSTSLQNVTVIQEIEAVKDSDRQILLTAYLQRLVGKILGFKGSQLPSTEQNFLEMGMDSLMVVELRNQIQTDLKLDIPIAIFMEGASIVHLSTKLNHQLDLLNVIQTVEPEGNDQFLATNVKDNNWIEIEL
jgi:acyl carrier protein